ncbi:MAG: sigma-70 family RNA polymerase sigma factor [Planctomycetia bacterium]|nr:sigma-70 family RNA polymerase sigma factor [Planctomycetia bacterium]
MFGAAVKDDAQLIDEALNGDSSAFGQLVTKYQDRLYNTLAHLVGSTDLAYDAVQDAFVQALVKLETFERSSSFYTWLYRIAFNQAISRRRREKPLVSVEQVQEASGHEPVDRCGPPESKLEQQERAAQVRAALAKVSDEHRAILILREVDDCPYEQIAEILDLPIGTIRSRLHRARLQLRDQLKGVFQEDVT